MKQTLLAAALLLCAFTPQKKDCIYRHRVIVHSDGRVNELTAWEPFTPTHDTVYQYKVSEKKGQRRYQRRQVIISPGKNPQVIQQWQPHSFITDTMYEYKITRCHE